VTGSLEAPHPNGAVHSNDEGPQHPWRRRLLLAGLVVFGLAWGYAILYSVTRDSPEKLDEATRADVAAACASAETDLRALPDLDDSPGADEAVALVRSENEIFIAMVREIRADAESGGDAGAALAAWADDWQSMIDVRALFASDLESDGTARLEIPTVEEGGIRPITDRMDEYAEARGLDECIAHELQIEIVDGPRDYADPED
jgi:hypothetical protein